MKTKRITKITSLLFVLIMCVAVLSGCGAFLSAPKLEEAVTGNGSLAVQKGDYLYFVNGYTAISDMTDGDNNGSENYSAIYVAKLENNQLQYDGDGKIKDCNKLVGGIVGFDKTKLYIFGDRIYYSTPNTERVITDTSNTSQSNFEFTDFNSICLDGSGFKHIYKSTKSSASFQYAYYKTTNVNHVSLAIFDGTDLIVVNCDNGGATKVAENVSSVAMPQVKDFNWNNNTITKQESAIYYTRSAKEDEEIGSGNVLAYTVLGENIEKPVKSGDYTFAVKTVTKDALVITMDLIVGTTNNFYVDFKADGTLNFDLNVIENQQLDSSGIDKVYLCAFEADACAGYLTINSNNNLAYVGFDGNIKVLYEDKTLTPLCLTGNYMYVYDANKSLYRVNYKNAIVAGMEESALELIYDSTEVISEEGEEEETAKDIYFDATVNFSVSGNYAYFYLPYEGESETGYYLNRVYLIGANNTAELVGVVQDIHVKAEVEENA